MRKLPFFLLLLLISAFLPLSCRMQPRLDLGDTIPESVFWFDTTKQKVVEKMETVLRDSANVFYVGTGSTPTFLQLVSYPSRRDTLMAGKLRPLHVKGNADYGHVIRVMWTYRSDSDSIVSFVEEVLTDTVKRMR